MDRSGLLSDHKGHMCTSRMVMKIPPLPCSPSSLLLFNLNFKLKRRRREHGDVERGGE